MKKKLVKYDFKIGRKRFGEIVIHEDGRKSFVLMRSLKDIHRGEHGYIRHAMDEGVAAWSVETLLLSKMQAREIDFLVIQVREDKSRYITPLSRFIEESEVMTRRMRNRSMQRSLPLTRFVKKPGVVKV